MTYRAILASLLATDQTFRFHHKPLYNNHRILTTMAKNSVKAVSKKECPSCGLRVTEELSICEFCGWDFQEEDEWILQIEKLERDLMLEKQKFEPGTVNHRIESTLRSPILERVESSVPAKEEAIDIGEEEVPISVPERTVRTPSKTPAPVEAAAKPTEVRRVRSVKTPTPIQEKPRQPEPVPERKIADAPVRKARAPPAEAAPPVLQRKVRTVATPPPAPEPEEKTPPTRKTRTVRRVKQ